MYVDVDSPYTTTITRAILDLQEGGDLAELKNKWWKEMYGGGECDVSANVNISTIFSSTFCSKDEASISLSCITVSSDRLRTNNCIKLLSLRISSLSFSLLSRRVD